MGHAAADDGPRRRSRHRRAGIHARGTAGRAADVDRGRARTRACRGRDGIGGPVAPRRAATDRRHRRGRRRPSTRCSLPRPAWPRRRGRGRASRRSGRAARSRRATSSRRSTGSRCARPMRCGCASRGPHRAARSRSPSAAMVGSSARRSRCGRVPPPTTASAPAAAVTPAQLDERPLGLTLRAVAGRGSEVLRVQPGSIAEAAGLRAGDVVVALGRTHAPAPGGHHRRFRRADAGPRRRSSPSNADGQPRLVALQR